jgi:hypothetical protein
MHFTNTNLPDLYIPDLPASHFLYHYLPDTDTECLNHAR